MEWLDGTDFCDAPYLKGDLSIYSFYYENQCSKWAQRPHISGVGEHLSEIQRPFLMVIFMSWISYSNWHWGDTSSCNLIANNYIFKRKTGHFSMECCSIVFCCSNFYRTAPENWTAPPQGAYKLCDFKYTPPTTVWFMWFSKYTPPTVVAKLNSWILFFFFFELLNPVKTLRVCKGPFAQLVFVKLPRRDMILL